MKECVGTPTPSSENAAARPPTPDGGRILPQGRTLQLAEGTTLVRELAGPPGAPVVVLLHGVCLTADVNWSTSMPSLARYFRVVAFDQRGHGRGIRTRSSALEDWADDVAAVLEALNVADAVIAGYSLGGVVAQLVWRRHPEVVRGLVLCATGCDFRRPLRHPLELLTLCGMSAFDALSHTSVGLDMVGAWLLGNISDRSVRQWVIAELRTTDLATVTATSVALSRFYSIPWIRHVSVPVSVLVTSADRVVPAHRQLELARLIPTATVHRVQGDHAVFLHDPAAFVPVLVEACRTAGKRFQQDDLDGTQRLAVAPLERRGRAG